MISLSLACPCSDQCSSQILKGSWNFDKVVGRFHVEGLDCINQKENALQYNIFAWNGKGFIPKKIFANDFTIVLLVSMGTAQIKVRLTLKLHHAKLGSIYLVLGVFDLLLHMP